jgi:zinc protease
MKQLAWILVTWSAISLGAETLPEIPFEEFRLDNGLRVIVHEDHKAPIVGVTVWYHVGSKNEVIGKTGFAHLFEHLMFNGSEHHNDEYFNPLQQVGATSINGTTDFDRTNYFQTVPSSALDLALWLESDRMGHLLGAIDQAKLDEQRGVVQNEKRQRENQPYGTVFERIMANMFPPEHPYSWMPIGSMEDLDNASLEDVKTWFESYYGPNNATLVISGDVDPAVVREKVAHYFGDIPPGPPITRQGRWIPRLAADRRIEMQDRVPQARLYKVWSAPEWGSRDGILLELLDGVLTGGKTSRLYRRLVYDDQVATDVSSFYLDNEIAGAIGIAVTALPGVELADIEGRLEEELERLIDVGPDEAELTRVKTETVAAFIRGVEQVGGFRGKANILAENAVFGGRPDFYEQTFATFTAADERAVRDATARWLGAPSLTVEVEPFPADLRAAPTGAERSSLPMPTEFPQASFPQLRRARLSNGMQLIVAERHAVPVIEFSLQLDAGFAADQLSGHTGTANLTMEMIDEGTTSRDALEISDTLARLGAELRTGSNLDRSFVSLSALREYLDPSLEMFADVILDPSFPPSELERLRSLQLSSIQQEQSDPQLIAMRVLPQLLYGDDHIYALPMTGSGTEASVSAITREDLIEFHQSWFAPANATMIVTGDTTLEEIQPKLEALFARWRGGDTPTKNIAVVAPPEGPRLFLVDRPGSQQSIVIAGQLIAGREADREIAVETMNDILGGNFTSRINMNLREDKGWSYGTRSMIVDTEGQRPLFVYAPVQADRTAAAMQEIAREIEQIVGPAPVTPEEVSRAKNRSILTLPGRWETTRAVLGDIAALVRFDLPDDYWNRYPDLVERLEVDEVAAEARAQLAPNRLTWVVVGDLRAIESEVRALGFGEIRIIDTEGRPADESAPL